MNAADYASNDALGLAALVAPDLTIGVQFAARIGREPTPFRLAGQLEQTRPWAGSTPPAHVSRPAVLSLNLQEGFP